jgi:aminopeptidase N
MTPADRTAGLGQVAYNKPGLGLRLLRDRILGPERFDRAFVEYVRRWAYRHPTPADFFRTMEDVSGEDLSWFWRGWFHTTGTLDQAVDSVAVADSAGSVTSRIYLRNAGQLVMPVELELAGADGAKERMQLPVEVWFGGPRYLLELRGRRVASVAIDPDSAYPDVRRDNNAWGGAR